MLWKEDYRSLRSLHQRKDLDQWAKTRTYISYPCVLLSARSVPFCSFRKFFMHINFLPVPKFTYLSSEPHSSSSFVSVYFWHEKKKRKARRGRGEGDVQSIFPYRWAHLQHKGMTEVYGGKAAREENESLLHFLLYLFLCMCVCVSTIPLVGWFVIQEYQSRGMDGRFSFWKARSLLSIFCCQFLLFRELERKKEEVRKRARNNITTREGRERKKLINLFSPLFIVEWWLIGTTTEQSERV